MTGIHNLSEAYMLLPPLPSQPIPVFVAAVVVIAASTDITARRIPNRLILIGLLASFVVHLCLEGLVAGAGNWLAGGMTGFALLIPLYLVRGTSAGDVKLLLMIGSWVGPEMVLAITLATFVIGGAWSIAFAVLSRQTLQLLLNLQTLLGQGLRPMRTAGAGAQPRIVSVGSLPYGIAIAAGTLGVLFAAAA